MHAVNSHLKIEILATARMKTVIDSRYAPAHLAPERHLRRVFEC